MEVNQQINQEVLHDNKEIFNRIEAELKKAEFEIQVASAWFTDDVLFDILLDQLAKGVKVEVIIADNSENEKLDFPILISKGATVLKIKNVGYGMMHQKFCIIDRKKALHGSYNWSNNAKNNNHESIIVTDHKETVESLINNFNNIRERAKAILSGDDIPIDRSYPEIKKLKPIEDSHSFKTEYEKVLDSMIAAEVSSFNRETLRQQGYDRSKSNNGDHQVLNKALDTLYNGFINDIDVIEDKKRRLLTKIDEQKAKSDSILKEKCELQIATINEENEILQNNLDNKIISVKSDLLIGEAAISQIKQNEIPHLKTKVDEIETVIKESQLEFVKPGIKWFEASTITFIGVGLFLYLVMFYSSAAYILLFSEADALLASKISSDPVPLQVFDSKALSKAWDRGFGALIFILFFVLIPLTFSVLSRIMKNKKLANWLTYTIGVVVIDTAIAIKVTKAIVKVNNDKEIDITTWNIGDVFTDINFYLVFILGAFGLIAFKFCFEKISQMIDERNPDVATQRNKLFVKQKRDEITVIEEDIFLRKSEIEEIEKENILKKSQISTFENELSNIPLKKALQIENKKNDLSNKLQVIDATTMIYKSHIENDNIPVSVDALKDRINIFLEGWSDYLHHEYAIPKAIEKSASATEVALIWESEKLNRGSIDSRVKIK
jgi:hypothetical protein